MYIENLECNQPLFYSYWEDQYLFVLFYLFFSFGLVLLLFIAGFMLSPKETQFEKTSAYECGFEPFGDAHSIFSIQFFVVGILFMLFDLELAYLFPWVFCLGNLPIYCVALMFFFLILLVIGFIYEWKKGALDWL